MLKKILISIFAILLFAGCTGSSGSEKITNSELAAGEIVSYLKMTDMEKMQNRFVKGEFFDSEDIYKEACVYHSSDENNSDLAGVFYVEDIELAKSYLQTYLNNLKKQQQLYYPDEVFKVSNAILTDNGKDLVVLIICNDIESARYKAEQIVGRQ